MSNMPLPTNLRPSLSVPLTRATRLAEPSVGATAVAHAGRYGTGWNGSRGPAPLLPAAFAPPGYVPRPAFAPTRTQQAMFTSSVQQTQAMNAIGVPAMVVPRQSSPTAAAMVATSLVDPVIPRAQIGAEYPAGRLAPALAPAVGGALDPRVFPRGTPADGVVANTARGAYLAARGRFPHTARRAIDTGKVIAPMAATLNVHQSAASIVRPVSPYSIPSAPLTTASVLAPDTQVLVPLSGLGNAPSEPTSPYAYAIVTAIGVAAALSFFALRR